MKNVLTKKGVFIVSGISSIILLTWDYVGNFQLCGGKEWGDCVTTMAKIEMLFLFVLPLFLLSLITYKMRDEIFNAWLMFAKWWIPLTIILILLAPTTGQSLVPIDKGRVSLLMNAIFLLVSLLIV